LQIKRKKCDQNVDTIQPTAIIPVWLVVFGLFAVFGSPTTFATGMVLLLVAGVALTKMRVL
jgi:hypothetical protein